MSGFSRREVARVLSRLDAEQREVVASVVQEMNALAADRGGKFHRDEGVERLVETHDFTESRAGELLERLFPFDERGFAYASSERTGARAFDGDLSGVAEPPGRMTDEDYHGLSVLERRQGGHPLIPPEGAYFERTIEGTNATDVEVLCRALSDPDFSPLLVGEAGTGKDALVKHVCAKTNRPVVRVNFGSDVRYENLVGMYILNDEGEMEWIDGALTKAVRHGWVFVADEINAAPPESTMPLHQVTEESDEAGLFLRERSEMIDPHPQFRFVATMNPAKSYGGANELNDAFKSRFYAIEVDYLDPEREAELLAERTADIDSVSRDDVDQLCTMADRLRTQHKRRDISTPVTTRELIKICKMAEIMSVGEAARMVLEGHAKDNDTDIIAEVVDTFF